jgi:polyisoprenoid-binding protein YceI
VESHKYPRAELKASILNNKDINYLKEGTYTATLKGQLTIHGVTKEISPPITIKVHREKIEVTSVFPLLLSDYRIAIPAIVKDKISNNVKVTADLKLEPLKQ